MTRKSKTPTGSPAEVSRNPSGAWLRDPLTPNALQAQFLIAACHVRPEWAAMLAASAFGEAGQ